MSLFKFFFEIDNNKVAVGGYKIIRIVNIKGKQIEARIECHNCLISSITDCIR